MFVEPDAASVIVIRPVMGKEYLLLRRAEERLHGVWLNVAGKIEAGEKAEEAALRELREESGLTPSRFYAADKCEVFYDRKKGGVRMTPVFVAFVEADAAVTLDKREHDSYEWLSLEEACERLMPMQQDVLRHVDTYFVKKEPNPILIFKEGVDLY